MNGSTGRPLRRGSEPALSLPKGQASTSSGRTDLVKLLAEHDISYLGNYWSGVNAAVATQAVVLAGAHRQAENLRMQLPPVSPSPAPWTFADRIYGLAHCLIDHDGRVIGCNLPIGNGPLLEQAPAMAALLRELAAGVPAEQLHARAAVILRQVDRPSIREPARG